MSKIEITLYEQDGYAKENPIAKLSQHVGEKVCIELLPQRVSTNGMNWEDKIPTKVYLNATNLFLGVKILQEAILEKQKASE